MIQFDCPKCLQQINAHDPQAGQRMNCPSCDTSLMVPAASGGDFDDLFDSDEQILDTPPTKEDPPTISNQLLDEGIDSKSKEKVQSSPNKQPRKKETKDAAGATSSSEQTDDPSEIFENLEFPETTDPIDESSEIFEDLEFPETTDQVNPVAVTEIPTEDPFAVDPDKRLDIDGITDISTAPDSFSIQCPVCDSHLFVTGSSIGTEVKCDDCHSAVTVPEPSQKQIDAANEKTKTLELAALDNPKEQSAQPVADVDVDPSFGLAPVNEDLLSPLQESDEEDDAGFSGSPDDELKLEGPTELFGDLDEFSPLEPTAALASGLASGPTSDSASGKGGTQDTDQEKIDPYRSRSKQEAKRKKRRKKNSPKPEASSGLDFPKFEFDSLFGEMVNLVSTPTVAVRSIFAALLLAAGNVVGHFALSNYQEIQDPTMGDTAFMAFWRIGAGWTLFGLGTLILWYTAGIIFRKTAVGERTIDSWRIGPSTEWTSTFLLIGFSFAVAGSPLLMFGATWLSAPLRFFFALPMLVSVWYTQSPFKIISVDAFSRYRRQRPQWRSVWLVVFALASIAFASGLMMAIPYRWINIITSLIGAVMLAFTTLGYAAVAGWHSGKVVEDLN